MLELLGEVTLGNNLDYFGSKYKLLKDEALGKDGKVYCRKCRKSRLYEIQPGRYVHVICKCQEDQLNREEEERAKQEKLDMLEKMREYSLISDRYKDVSFKSTITGQNESFDIAFARCQKYVLNADLCLKDGLGIYMYGDRGCGKTHLSACMVNHLINNGYSAMLTSFTRIVEDIKSSFGGNHEENERTIISKYSSIDFLFIDDIGTERFMNNNNDTYMQEKVYEVINDRYNKRKPTIFTSNYSIKEIVNEQGMSSRTADRIYEMASAILHIEGKSFRVTQKRKELPF